MSNETAPGDEPTLIGKRPDEMGGLFSVIPQLEALVAEGQKIVAAIDPAKIRDLFDAIKVDGDTVTLDVKLILRKTVTP